MTASNKLLIVHLEKRVGGGEELRMEYNLERDGRREREREGIRIKLPCGAPSLENYNVGVHV